MNVCHIDEKTNYQIIGPVGDSVFVYFPEEYVYYNTYNNHERLIYVLLFIIQISTRTKVYYVPIFSRHNFVL